MKKSLIMKVLGIISVLGVTVASTASFIGAHEPKRPEILK